MATEKNTPLMSIEPLDWENLKKNDFYSAKVNVKDIILAYSMDAVEQQGEKHLMYLSMGIRKTFLTQDTKNLHQLLNVYYLWSNKRYEPLFNFKPEATLYPMLKMIMAAAMIDNDAEEVYKSKIKNTEPHLRFIQKEYFGKNNHEVTSGMKTYEHDAYLKSLREDENFPLEYMEYTDPSGILQFAIHKKDWKTLDMLFHYAEEMYMDSENFLLSLATDADYSRDWADLIRQHGIIPPGPTYTGLSEYFHKKHKERKSSNH